MALRMFNLHRAILAIGMYSLFEALRNPSSDGRSPSNNSTLIYALDFKVREAHDSFFEGGDVHPYDVDDAFARRCAALIDQERTLIPSSTPPNKSGSR